MMRNSLLVAAGSLILGGLMTGDKFTALHAGTALLNIPSLCIPDSNAGTLALTDTDISMIVLVRGLSLDGQGGKIA